MADRPPSGNACLPEPTEASPRGNSTLVLDNRNYQNLKFDLSADGQTIVVQRVNRKTPPTLAPGWCGRARPPTPSTPIRAATF
jgi:hypothetical protein